jgi:glucosamine 6-phosphate synthetase-like amidotransferase/phosphosugar isomerase protein
MRRARHLYLGGGGTSYHACMLGAGYLARVLQGYAVAFPVAFTCVVIFRPVVLFLVKKTVHPPPSA